MEAIVINSRKLKYKKRIKEEKKFNEIILNTRNNLVKSSYTDQNETSCNSISSTAYGFMDVSSGKSDKTDSEKLVLSNKFQISNEYKYNNNVYAAPSDLDLEQVLTPYYYEKDDLNWINELISYEWLLRNEDTL